MLGKGASGLPKTEQVSAARQALILSQTTTGSFLRLAAPTRRFKSPFQDRPRIRTCKQATCRTSLNRKAIGNMQTRAHQVKS